ncbi:protein phosphatase Slingshot isoform X2 [Uranotaenia lowii]|uniref:protein phosphatase Slingshot isoform X2 n=1 Tax=Uranotaenia lowii TaxID=190385 RepID=UPI0024786B6A|nr:protein phosphatase Slingshot isoform X2 [Uranotaenia lowii]
MYLIQNLSECHFARKGTILMLGSNERLRSTNSEDLQQKLSQEQHLAHQGPPSTGTIAASPQHQSTAPNSSSSNVSPAPVKYPPRSRSDSAEQGREETNASSTGSSSGASTASSSSSSSSAGNDIQQHLQSMFNLLRPEETLKMAVKLESLRAGRTRYLVVVSRPPQNNSSRSSSRQQPQQGPQVTGTSSSSLSSSNSSTNFPPLAAPSSSAVPPLSSIVPLSKQITSAALYKAASPCATSGAGVIAGEETTFVSSLDNCVLSASSLVSTTTSVTASSGKSSTNKSVDKCDSDKPSSSGNNNNNNNSNCNVNSYSSVVASGSVKVCSAGPSGYINVTSIGGIGAGAGSLAPGASSTRLLGGNASSAVGCGGGGGGSGFSSRSQSSAAGGCCGAEMEESCLLGIDCNEKTTVGLVLRVLADTAIRLDGDGGFSVSTFGQQHIFKPVSVQAMWSALQTLHKVSSKAREHNFFAGGTSHEWVSYYERHIDSDRSCLNEWHAMDALESRRPPSPDSIRNKPTEREETERVIRTKLKEIMMTVDLDVVTSKFIRGRLEEQLDMDLGEYKSFIDEEMLVILGQMDAPTEIFDHVYLGSEWNASNLEELQKNGVRHILNVTREIDNFFPGMFDYFNVRVYDDDKTDLLKHWDNTYKYISRVRMEGSKVLVHCKMGISRSASVVIAYAMKANSWDFAQALQHVKEKRTCIKPNKNFIMQLETYQGILDAMKNREKLQRSKSETNLKSGVKDARLLPGSEPTPLIQALNRGSNTNTLNKSGRFLRKLGKRPKSWSPDTEKVALLLSGTSRQQSHSLEHLMAPQNEPTTIRMPCGNGQNYSVSQNQIVHLQEGVQNEKQVPSSVRLIVNELESNRTAKESSIGSNNGNHKRKGSTSSISSLGMGLSLAPSSSSSEVQTADEDTRDHQWDPGEKDTSTQQVTTTATTTQQCDISTAQPVVCWTSQSQIIQQAPAHVVPPPVANLVSRQSSWSSVDSAVVADMMRSNFSASASRNSSWGSGDNQQGQRMAPAPPSRNSSWGSYDTGSSNASSIQTVVEVPTGCESRGSLCEDPSQTGVFPDDIPWHPGTVKRTKQKIEERSGSSIKRICSEKFSHKHSKMVDDRGKATGPSCCQQRSNSEEALPSNRIGGMASTTYTRLSASAPDSYCLCPFGTAKKSDEGQTPANFSGNKGHHRRFSFRKSIPDEKKPDANDENTALSVSGLVKNLKMSFEAKVSSDRSRKDQKKVRSLPSSPVAIHVEMNKQPQQQGQNQTAGKQEQQPSPEDITVKDLVDRYEAPRFRSSFNTHHRHNSSSSAATTAGSEQIVLRPRPRSVFEPIKYAQQQNHPTKPFMISHSSTFLKSGGEDFSRPPAIPTGGPIVRGIIIGSSNNNSGSCHQPGNPGSNQSTTKKVVQHHGKTHPLAKINLTKHRINATSTTAAAQAYNTM